MKTLDKLKVGETAEIKTFTDPELSLKFMEMGCIPGEKVVLQQIAPLGCPIAIEVAGYLLSMRRSEAATIVVN